MVNPDIETVTITKAQHRCFLAQQRKLEALHRGGVDNWEWFSESINQYIQDEQLTEDEADDIWGA